MKKLLSALLVLVFVFAIQAPAFADEKEVITIQSNFLDDLPSYTREEFDRLSEEDLNAFNQLQNIVQYVENPGYVNGADYAGNIFFSADKESFYNMIFPVLCKYETILYENTGEAVLYQFLLSDYASERNELQFKILYSLHEVKKGDNLWKIATKGYSVPNKNYLMYDKESSLDSYILKETQELMTLNQLDSDVIYPGQIIAIPVIYVQ